MFQPLLLLVLAAPPTVAPPSPPAASPAVQGTAPSFGPVWKKLLGEWTGEGGGAAGVGGGSASFRIELDGRVIVRKAVADYPAREERPATHHEDLLVLSPGATPANASAVYFDNEGHVIRYDASWSADGSVLTFVSAAGAPGPRFRLTHTFTAADAMAVSFEIAPPGGEFRTYVGGVMRRSPGR